MEKLDALKLYNLINEVLEKELLKIRNNAIANKDIKVPKESLIFLDSAYTSINNAQKLLNDDNFVDSLCLLRSSFEAIMFSLAIRFDKKTYDVYKSYNSNIYKESLDKKYELLKRKNPKYKAHQKKYSKQDYLKPKRIRSIVSKNYEIVFGDFTNDINEVDKELGDFYKYLCDFTHPSICKTYFFKMQNDKDLINNIKIIFKINIDYCKMLLLLAVNYFSDKNKIENYLDLYGILFISSISLVDDVSSFKQVIKKYEEYLYIDLTRKYFNSNKEKAEMVKKQLKEIANDNNSGLKAADLIVETIRTLKFEHLISKYFPE
jgi:hypothetical protein